MSLKTYLRTLVKNGGSKAAMPGGATIQYGTITEQTSFTVPCDGYFQAFGNNCTKLICQNASCELQNYLHAATGSHIQTFVPVKAGQKVTVNFTGTNAVCSLKRTWGGD